MKQYIQYITQDTKGEPCEMVGSEGVVILDGRLSLDSCIVSAHHLMGRHFKKKYIIGFKIIKSDRFIHSFEDHSKTKHYYLKHKEQWAKQNH